MKVPHGPPCKGILIPRPQVAQQEAYTCHEFECD